MAFVGSAAKLGSKIIAAPFKMGWGGAKAYGKTVAGLNWRKPSHQLLGAAMIGAPTYAAGRLAYHADKPSPVRTVDYGDYLSQQTMSGALPVSQMSTYDMNRSLGSTQARGLMKLNSLEKQAAFMSAIGAIAKPLFTKAIPKAFGAVKSFVAPAVKKTIGKGGAFSPGNVALGTGFTAMTVGDNASTYGKQMRQSAMQAGNLMNETPIL